MNFYSESNSVNNSEAFKANKNRYIFFKDQKAISNFIDIEICLKNNPNFKCLMVIEQSNPISILKSKIPESIDKFHKISGLFYPKVTSLSLKRDKDKEILLPLDSSQLIEEVIKPGDLVIFELKFKEIWISVNLTCSCLEKNISFDFEIKSNIEKTIYDLACILIKMGMKSWYYNKNKILNNNNNDDYFVFSKFEIRKVNDSNEEVVVSFSSQNAFNESNCVDKKNMNTNINNGNYNIENSSFYNNNNNNINKLNTANNSNLNEYYKEKQIKANYNQDECNLEVNTNIKIPFESIKANPVYNSNKNNNNIKNIHEIRKKLSFTTKPFTFNNNNNIELTDLSNKSSVLNNNNTNYNNITKEKESNNNNNATNSIKTANFVSNNEVVDGISDYICTADIFKTKEKIKEIKHLKIKDWFNYDSKIECSIVFENLNQLCLFKTNNTRSKYSKSCKARIDAYIKHNSKK